MKKVDFHTHSTCSDGLLSPIDMIKRAKSNGVSYYSLTDHDTTEGLQIASDEAKRQSINFIPGIELSTDHNNESIHILGYFKDDSYKNRELNDFLNTIKSKREIRAKKIIQKLKEEFNIVISYDNLQKNSNDVIARPHIAREIIRSGYNYSFSEIFDLFIGKDCKAYVPTTKISTENGISLLKKYNALVFLAHPILIKKSPLNDFLKMDFNGIEAIYYQNTPEFEKEILGIAHTYNKLISVGSDFHGNLKDDKRHGDIGSISYRYKGDYLNDFLDNLKI